MSAHLLLLTCALLAPAAALVAAEPPARFAWSLPIELDAREHQGVMRRDLADIRVFNAAGEAVPHAFAPLPPVAPGDHPAIALPFFPVQAGRGARMDGVDVRIQTRADGTVLGLTTRAPGAGSEQRIVGYLVDASAVERPLAALRLRWAPA